MSPHDEMLDSVAAYAVGALSPQEAADVAAHMRDCAECREEYRRLRPVVTAVAYSAEACADSASGGAVPSPLLKARIMRQVRGEVRSSRPSRVWPAYAAAAACLALAIVAGLVDVSLTDRLGRERAEIVEQNQTIADFTAPDSRRRPFAGGEVLLHGPRVYIAMRDVPMPPRGKVYQAWTLAKGSKTVAPSQTFMPAASGMTVVRLPEAATTLAAVAVSIEPQGGSRQPTSKPIAMVSL
jgi:anti-sigma-K factor RskA